MVKYSVYQESRKEMDLHKWLESEKVGFDLGIRAFRGWLEQHWRSYVCARWMEHLQGIAFWAELDRNNFGIIPRLEQRFRDRPDLFQAVIDRVRIGQENLTVIQWAVHREINCDLVLEILESLDINSRRLPPRFEF